MRALCAHAISRPLSAVVQKDGDSPCGRAACVAIRSVGVGTLENVRSPSQAAGQVIILPRSTRTLLARSPGGGLRPRSSRTMPSCLPGGGLPRSARMMPVRSPGGLPLPTRSTPARFSGGRLPTRSAAGASDLQPAPPRRRHAASPPRPRRAKPSSPPRASVRPRCRRSSSRPAP
eukprot:scaffold9148_cov59-Phaeocystis_antarctica.AAC.2